MDGPNWYAYCGNSPLAHTDPTGMGENIFQRAWGGIKKLLGFETANTGSTASSHQATPAPANATDNIDQVDDLSLGDVATVGLVETYMTQWNSSRSYTSEDFLPGSEVTEDFGVGQGPNDVGATEGGQTNWYETSAHAGIDRVATAVGQSVVAPVYLRVLSRDGNRLTMSVVGTERNVTVQHASPNEVAATQAGQVFNPGAAIVTYPQQLYGTGTGPHVHIQETTVVSGSRTFINPDTHQPVSGATYQYRRGTSTGQNPTVWASWMSFTAY